MIFGRNTFLDDPKFRMITWRCTFHSKLAENADQNINFEQDLLTESAEQFNFQRDFSK